MPWVITSGETIAIPPERPIIYDTFIVWLWEIDSRGTKSVVFPVPMVRLNSPGMTMEMYMFCIAREDIVPIDRLLVMYVVCM